MAVVKVGKMPCETVPIQHSGAAFYPPYNYNVFRLNLIAWEREYVTSIIKKHHTPIIGCVLKIKVDSLMILIKNYFLEYCASFIHSTSLKKKGYMPNSR